MKKIEIEINPKEIDVELEKHTSGARFIPGPKGEQGGKGEKGDKGDRGEQGPRGFDGINGIDGRDGIDGKDGADGIDGKDGKDGKQGPRGPKGEKGDKMKFSDLTPYEKQVLTGPQGSNGVGVPRGGTTGQKLIKSSSKDFHTEWADDTGSGAVDSVNGQTGAVVLDQDDVGDGTTYKQYSATEKTKLAGIEAGAEVNNISDANATDLTDGGDTTLHTHDSRYYTETETNTLLSAKQDTLVSGTNIKTINSTSILGSGNIVITGGSGDVVGPASSTDGVPALFDTTTGKLLKNSTPTGTGNPVMDTNPTFATRINTPEIKATSSAGVDIHNNAGTQVALFGAGGSTGSTLVGTTNIGSASADYHQVAGGTGTITDTATGSSTNININLVPKGTGRLQSGGTTVPTISSSDTLTNKTVNLSSNALTGTKAEFNTAVSDGNIVYEGAVTSSGLTMATSRLLGRSTASTGAVEEISVGSGLTLSGGTLSASGSGTKIGLGGFSQTTTQNTTTETTHFTTTVPAGTLGTANAMRFRIGIANWSALSTGSCTIRVKYGGTTIASFSANNNSGGTQSGLAGYLEGIIFAKAATNVQGGYGNLLLGDAGAVDNSIFTMRYGSGSSAIDSTSDQTFLISVQWNNASNSNTITTEFYSLEKIA